ncbi:hypothetical protein GCM10020221_12750 [Streptomyces thioluteus]|uniref:Glycosyl transferase family 2 n=1 Tax=Streptomyces thioluteus TaxID=66431 RepID=A0ABN3WIX5_STRTU
MVAAARSGGLDLVSQMARLRVATVWEQMIVPAFRPPLRPVSTPSVGSNRPGTRHGRGRRRLRVLLRRRPPSGPHPDSVRHAVIDDVSVARAVKRSGGRIWLGLAERVDSVRPYSGLAPLWRMVSRSAYAQLLYNPLLLLGTVAGLAVVYLAPPVAVAVGAVTGAPVTLAAGTAAWALMAGTYVPMLRYYRQPLWLAPLFPVTALLYLLMTVDSAVQHHRGRGAAWKGRTYARPEPAPRPGE